MLHYQVYDEASTRTGSPWFSYDYHQCIFVESLIN